MLIDWSQGRREVLDELMPIVYEELRRLARRYLQGERAGVHVFDVTQTEGDSLPPPPPEPKRLEGDEDGLLSKLGQFAIHHGIRVLDEAPKTSGANGEYSPTERTIPDREGINPRRTPREPREHLRPPR